jgi:hypothetical protein
MNVMRMVTMKMKKPTAEAIYAMEREETSFESRER